jgi:bacteriocin-like protein
MHNEFCELSFDELDEVSGGIIPDGYCLAKGPGGEGLYPKSTPPCNAGPSNPLSSVPGGNAIWNALHPT